LRPGAGGFAKVTAPPKRRHQFNTIMKPIGIAFVVWMLGLAAAPAALSRLDAISQIESGDNDRAVGDAGEVSRFQILPRVWRHYSMSRVYANPGLARHIAQQHLAHLETTFRMRAGREASDFDCYVLWNGGPTYYAKIGFRPERVHRIIQERARRFVNLRVMESEPTASAAMLAIGALSP
jgi:hypothetical protein